MDQQIDNFSDDQTPFWASWTGSGVGWTFLFILGSEGGLG